MNDRPATIAEADREYATNVGATRPNDAWILSDRDVWYANPYYHGPTVPHPDSYDVGDDDIAQYERRHQEPADFEDDLPF